MKLNRHVANPAACKVGLKLHGTILIGKANDKRFASEWRILVLRHLSIHKRQLLIKDKDKNPST